MNIQMSFDPTLVKFSCGLNTPLTEFSFAIEQGVNWFFGRGITHFKSSRKGLECVMEARMPAKPMAYSQITSVGYLVNVNYWPKDLKAEEIFQIPTNSYEVRTGHQRYQAGKDYTVIRSYELKPTASCGEIAYGVSDMVTGLFWLGATYVHYQLSMGTIQVKFDKIFAKGELERYIQDPSPGYDLTATVSELAKR